MMISLLFIFNTCLAGAQIIRVTQHPANVTLCEGSNAVLSCVVFNNDTNIAANTTGWFRIANPPVGISSNINNTRNGDVVTSVLTVVNVSLNDDGTGYLCSPTFGIRSYVGVISVITDPASPNITVPTPLSSTSFTVSWTITDNYIIIAWTNLRTCMLEGNMIVPENTNSSNVTGLNGIDNYIVSVTANNSCGMMMSDPITVYGPPAAAPMNITFPPNNTTRESFIVHWDAVMDLFTVNYTVRWYSGDNEIGMASVDGLSYTVTGLTPNTNYRVTVVAINTCCGAGPVSDVVFVMTKKKNTGRSNSGNGVIIATACVITFIMTLFAA